MDTVESLLKKIISIPSLTKKENVFCDFLFNYLVEQKLAPEKVPVDDHGYNIVIKVGNPRVYLCAHMDTVEPFIPFSEDRDSIYGRGSCDTKGSLAAMIVAAQKAKDERISNFGCIFAVGEESNFRGIYKVLESKLNIPFAVVGEPTSLEIVNGHYGILILSLAAEGQAAHSSKPENGINAINKLIESIRTVNNELAIHPESLMSLVKINGGIADNIIPDHAEAILSFRLAPSDHTDYQAVIQQIVGDECLVKTTQSCTSIFCIVPKELEFIKIQRSVRYMTELSMLKTGIVIGPGDIQFAHTENEHVSKAELRQAVETYYTILQNFDK